MQIFSRFVVFGILIFILSACKKEKIELPVGGFDSPSVGQIFSSDDTLYFTVHFSHSRPITELSVRLLSLSGASILSSSIIKPNKEEGIVSGEIFLAFGFINTGNYNLELVLSDGSISSRTQRQIFINQIPKVRESVWVTYSNPPNNYVITLLDSIGTSFSLNGSHLFTEIDSKNDILYTSGKNSGDLKAFDINNNILKWSVPNPGQGIEGYFRAGLLDNELVYVSREDGFITAYDKFKGVRYNATLNSGLYVEQFLISNTFPVGEKKSIPPGQTLISVFNTNGTGRHETFAGNGVEIVSMQKGLGFDVWIFANQGTGRIGRYDVSGNTLTWLYIMPSGTIINAEKNNNTKYWVSTSNGGLLEYTTNNNSLTPFNAALNPTGLKFDQVNNELFVWDSNTVRVLNPLTGQQMRSTTLPGTALSVNFLYNRD